MISSLGDIENKDLSIRVDQAEQWEVEEHKWLEKVELEEICSVENTVDKTVWFGYGEEWKAHEDLDGMIKRIQELSLHMDQSEKIPVPSHCSQDLKQFDKVVLRLGCEKCSVLLRTLAKHSISCRHEYIPSDYVCQQYNHTSNTLSGEGCTGKVMVQDEVSVVEQDNHEEARQEVAMEVTEQVQEFGQMEPIIDLTRQGKIKQQSNLSIGSCSQPSGSEGDTGGQQRKQDLGMNSHVVEVVVGDMYKETSLDLPVELAENVQEFGQKEPEISEGEPGGQQCKQDLSLNNEQAKVMMKTDDMKVLGRVELEVIRVDLLNQDHVNVTKKTSDVPRRGELAMGISKRMDSLQQSADKKVERRVVVAGRGRTIRKRMEGAMEVKRIEDFFDNTSQGGSNNNSQFHVLCDFKSIKN